MEHLLVGDEQKRKNSGLGVKILNSRELSFLNEGGGEVFWGAENSPSLIFYLRVQGCSPRRANLYYFFIFFWWKQIMLSVDRVRLLEPPLGWIRHSILTLKTQQ